MYYHDGTTASLDQPRNCIPLKCTAPANVYPAVRQTGLVYSAPDTIDESNRAKPGGVVEERATTTTEGLEVNGIRANDLTSHPRAQVFTPGDAPTHDEHIVSGVVSEMASVAVEGRATTNAWENGRVLAVYKAPWLLAEVLRAICTWQVPTASLEAATTERRGEEIPSLEDDRSKVGPGTVSSRALVLYKAPCLPMGVFVSEFTAIMDDVALLSTTEDSAADGRDENAAAVADAEEVRDVMSQNIGNASLVKLDVVELSKFSVSAETDNVLIRHL